LQALHALLAESPTSHPSTSDRCVNCGLSCSTSFCSDEIISTDILEKAVDQLLKTNSAPPHIGGNPPGANSAGIAVRLHAYEQELSHLRGDIQSVGDLLGRLELKKLRLISKISSYGAVLHPIKRLSNELWREIFITSLHQYSIDEGSILAGDTRDLHEFQRVPWTLSHVCRHWREIALSFPPLWSHVSCHFVEKHIDSRYYSCEIYRLIHQLNRASLYPLSVFLISQINFSQSLLHFHTVYSSSPRWRSLRVCIIPSCFDFLKGLSTMVSTLQTFSFNVVEPGGQLTFPISSPNAALTQMQFVLTLHRIVCPPALVLALPLALPRITHYATPIPPHSLIHDSFSSSRLLFAIQSMPSLKRCSLLISGSASSADSPISISYTVPSLESLTLADVPDRGGGKDFLSHLIAPSLQHLFISSTTGCNDLLESEFLPRSKCALKSLVFSVGMQPNGVGWEAEDLAKVMKACPTITELALDCTLQTLLETQIFMQPETLRLKTLLIRSSTSTEDLAMINQLADLRPGLKAQFVSDSFFDIKDNSRTFWF
jgi:hypothetical protein